jgi:hypothetical protein
VEREVSHALRLDCGRYPANHASDPPLQGAG